MNTELRITDTNSSNDSKGHALGLEGNDFVYVVIGIVAAIGVFLLLYAVFAAALLTATLISSIFVIVPTTWVLMFKHNRPEGFAEDFFDEQLNREGFTYASGNQPSFPFHHHYE